MSVKEVVNGCGLILFGLWALSEDVGLIDMVFINTYAILVLGVNFLVDGFTDKSAEQTNSIEERLQSIERKSEAMVKSLNDELDDLQNMVEKTQNVLGYKFKMFIEICITQFENLTQEWQNHFMLSEEFSSLFDKASRNSGLLTQEEKMKFAQWMNKALESLDENKIKKFAYSDDFRLYEEIIELYND